MIDVDATQALFNDLHAANEAALELAVLLSAAVRIEQPLVRRLRLQFLRASDASAEADLWFSLLVRARSALGITFRPDVIPALRDQLAERDDRQQVRDTIKAAHTALPPLLRLEECLVWLGIIDAEEDEIEAQLGQIVQAMLSSPSRRNDLSAWCARALPQLPLRVRRSAATWVLRNAAQSVVRVAIPLACEPPVTLADASIANLLPDPSKDAVVAVRHDRNQVVIDATPAASGFQVRVPGTHPLFVVVDHDGTRELVAVAAGECREIPVKSPRIDLRCLRGNHWRLAPQGTRRKRPSAGLGPVKGHALLVGASTKNLRGVHHDVRCMADMLEARGFDVDVRTGDRATRAGILAGYDELIARVSPDDAAVFYYTGSGFRAFVDNESRSWQGICPVDLEQTTAVDFRGITSWELSIKLLQLTQRTPNVTVILDCCHASQMSRGWAVPNTEHGSGLRTTVPRALPHPLRMGFDAHLASLRALYGEAFDSVGSLGDISTERGDISAVRLVACGPDKAAFEFQLPDGQYGGVFTTALLEILREVGDMPVSWARIENALRERVSRKFATQRPEIEGPARRQLFSLIEDDADGAVAITSMSNGLRLSAGALMGVARGDVYGVMPPGPPTYRESEAIAEVRVSDTSATWANVEVMGWKNGHSSMPAGAIAILAEKTAIRRAVKIDVPDAARDAVIAAIAATRTLRPAEADDVTALATLRLTRDALTIEDRVGPLFPATRFPDGLASTIKSLVNLAAAQGLRELEGEHGISASEIEVEWGTVDRGAMCRMPAHGGLLGLCDRPYVRIMNKAQRPLYAHIFNIGLRGKITLLTSAAPSGVQLTSNGQEFVLGQAFDGRLTGLKLSWPDGLPRDTFPRSDEIVVIITEAPASLRGLETAEAVVRTRAPGSKLQDLLAQLHDGFTRNTRDEGLMDGFLMTRLSYFLHPRDAAMANLPFEIDDDPLRQAATRIPEAWIPPRSHMVSSPRTPPAIGIRLQDVMVTTSAAVAGDLRLDALICTRSPSDGGGYATWTWRERAVEAGKETPADVPPMFRGAIHDFLDIYLWASHDADAPSLADLLAQRAATPELRDAVGALSAPSMRSGVPWIVAVGGSAALARIAYESLGGGGEAPMCLYRTSFVADERFGIGRHPKEGRYRTRSISFALSIEPAGKAGIPG